VTRDDIVAYTKHLIFENAATTGIGSDADIELTVDKANKKVWRYCVKQAPSLFEERVEDLPYSSELDYLDLAGVDERGIYLLSRVLVKAAQYLSTSGDPYILLDPLDGDERFAAGRNLVGSAAFIPRAYYLEGEHLHVVPQVGDIALQLIYIPNVATMTAETKALNGKLEPFHELVALEAAIVLAVKDEASLAGLVLLRNEAKKDLVMHLSKRQRQRPKVIREVPFV
jgi:hypothetical protein